MRTIKSLGLAAVLATSCLLAVPASAAPPTTQGQVIFRVAGPAMALRQDPVHAERAYAQREAHSRNLEDFTGGAIGIVAAVLIVLLVLLLI